MTTPHRSVLPDSYVPQVRSDFVRHDIGHEAVVWSVLRREPAALDPVSRILLEILDGRASVGELATDVSDVIGLPRELADAKVRESLDRIEAAGLLERSTGVPGSLADREVFLTPPNT